MLVAIGMVGTLVAALCWLLWAFGVSGEYPVRVLWVAIGATILAVGCVITWHRMEGDL